VISKLCADTGQAQPQADDGRRMALPM